MNKQLAISITVALPTASFCRRVNSGKGSRLKTLLPRVRFSGLLLRLNDGAANKKVDSALKMLIGLIRKYLIKLQVVVKELCEDTMLHVHTQKSI